MSHAPPHSNRSSAVSAAGTGLVRFENARAVLFDLDGTLIDSAPDLGAAANALRVERGLPPLPLGDYRHLAGAGARGMLWAAFGITPEHADFPALREAFFDRYEAGIHDRTHIFAGAEQLIATLQARNLAWGVVTNKMARFTNLIVQRMPLLASAGTVISGDTTAHPKPHPAPLLEAARRLSLAPQDCIYVGDDERDIQAAHAAGMPAVAALYGYLGPDTPENGWGAEAVIHAPLELLPLL